MFRALSFLCLVWGFNFVVMKTANDFFTPELFVTYRFTLGAAILLAVVFFAKMPLPPKKFVPWIILTGILQITLGSLLLQFCFLYLNAGLTSVLNYTMPIWVTILARFFLNESLTRKKIFGILLSIFGVGILMNIEFSGSFYAVFLALSAAMVWAISNVIMKMKLMNLNLIVLTTWQMTAGAVVLVIYTLAFGETAAHWTLTAVACVIYNGVLASALAFFLWCYILQHMEASKASVAILGVPVVSVVTSTICLGEPLTVTIIIGVLMVLSGIALVQRS